jgi:hypothetical protein
MSRRDKYHLGDPVDAQAPPVSTAPRCIDGAELRAVLIARGQLTPGSGEVLCRFTLDRPTFRINPAKDESPRRAGPDAERK